VIPGHGAPFNDVKAALERSFNGSKHSPRTLRSARHVLKVMLAFKLL